ncbi:MAG: hypothetical protein A3H79_03875 [Candidatus Levybacteria bacterium RIFCSPLOWO2_02_FULL_36_8b]|nr:MAG: hypothetical protein A3H79_03875 [Candidatus Levybacteria bacterium RIFCSPLOWO2_02_FULL_36_8b]
MDIINIVLIGLGLSMDAFAVSVGNGINIKAEKFKNALKAGVFFGIFQAFMPLIGWSVGINLKSFISSFDHWVAFGLLVLIGLKMIHESSKLNRDKSKNNLSSIKVLFMLAIVTSLDALIVGVSFAFINIPILTAAIIIGIITFTISFIGVFAGNRFGALFGKKAEIIGGLILILIGTKILLQHLFLN